MLKFNDANWSLEGRMDLVAEPSAKTLPAGTYTFSESGEPGTIGRNSYVDVYSPSSANLKLKDGSKVTVAVADGVYTITMDLKFTDDSVGKLTFNGEITGTPEFE